MSTALFACTKCHGRYPFEDLSAGEQMCRECRSHYPMLKCTYCRAEFQQDDKTSTSSVCKKCSQNIKVYGKPSACEYCNTIAAFIGNRCQRCANSEKKWGPPATCDQCKQRCAFDRSDDINKKGESKRLCWLCTMTYKRVLAKTMKTDLLQTAAAASNQSVKVSSATPDASTPTTATKESSKEHHHRHHHRHHKKGDSHRHRHHHHHKHSKDTEQLKSDESFKDNLHSDTTDHPSSTKKQKIDNSNTKSSSTNGFSLSQDSSVLDITSTNNMIAATQMKEEIEQLKKQLSQKEAIILEKDKKLTELKAQNFEFEKQMRSKISTIQKQSLDAQETLQGKNRELQKQVSQLSKYKKTGVNSPLTL